MLGALPATAQTAAAPAASDAYVLPTVTVNIAKTAQVDNPQQILSSDKTGTRLADLPASVQVVPRQIITDQGGNTLASAITNASGISSGGTDGFGISDNFLIRGLNARIYNDGYSEGDQRNSIPNSLNGVARVEILEGPGSALFGSGPPGGTIDLIHFKPSPDLHYGASLQFGSFGTVNNSYYLTGPSGVPGLNYRVDASIAHADGFRGLNSSDYEIRPAFNWSIGNHDIDVSVDARHIHGTADPTGIVYFHGAPLQDVGIGTFYSTPFSHDDQNLVQVAIADAWSVSDLLTVNSRFSYLHHVNDILRNSDGAVVVGNALTNRQLRQQTDKDDSFDYQLEPVWKFATGPIRHTLLTGFEAQYQHIYTNRSTADLPNITDIFDPIVPEMSAQGLTFLRDAKHSGSIDNLAATYLSVYAADQIDLTQRLKLRVGVRLDDADTTLTPVVFVPGRLQPNGQLFEPGVTYTRHDTPFSWNIGGLYKILPGISPYFGISKSSLSNFTSEATQNGLAAPESALQYEGGIKFALPDNRATLTAAAFSVKRDNVFTLVGDTEVFNNQTTNGVEADLNIQATPHWQIEANATSQHAALTDNPSNPAATGKQPIGVPAHIFNLWTSYGFAIAGLDGFQIGTGLNYRDKIYGDLLNTNSIPSYLTLNAVLAYKTAKWDVSLGLRNITDERYFVNADGAGAIVGEPASVFLAANIHY